MSTTEDCPYCQGLDNNCLWCEGFKTTTEENESRLKELCEKTNSNCKKFTNQYIELIREMIEIASESGYDRVLIIWDYYNGGTIPGGFLRTLFNKTIVESELKVISKNINHDMVRAIFKKEGYSPCNHFHNEYYPYYEIRWEN